jgi:osmotically inducible protein OsmC
MFKRTSTAVWQGSGPKGIGSISTTSGVLASTPYGVAARFVSEDGKAGTNPEELIAAAHASCFTMATAFQITNGGHEASRLETTASVTVEKQDAGWTITGIHLELTGAVPGVTDEQFQTFAEAAKKGCPISKALAAVPITLKATLSASAS